MIFRWRVGLVPSNRGIISGLGGATYISISGGLARPPAPASVQVSYAFVS